ncbi:MAG: glycosyl transferase [Nitrospirota bacterium]|jgi:glucosyl-3-phosphoglycerate synthase
MSDFYQTGVVATFHRLGASKLERIESELKWYSQERPVALVLPSLYSELQGEALKGIVTRLKEVEYVKQVIVALGPASEEEFKHARDFFSGLPQSTRVIWNHGPRLTEIYRALEAADLPPGEEGKGKSAWMAYGYVLSQMDLRVIALHDCDILTYGREMLARLCYPVVNPNLDYDFCKGFYSRVTDRMHGRVTRLLVTPLLRAISAIIGEQPLVQFFDSFRYPLAGEFSIDVDLSRVIRIPGDWGLEMGVLAEVYRNTSVRRVCQIDIAENYEHKHQVLSPEDATKGLNKMCIDISKSIFRTLASEGIIFSEGFFKTLLATYVRIAQDFLKRYEDDAAVNGLAFDRHNESLAVETFTSGIEKAAQIIMDNPVGVPLIPPWERVTSALPNILRHIRAAVDDDNA